MTSEEIQSRIAALSWAGLDYSSVPFVLDHKSGTTLVDVEGREYIDMITCWGSTPLGANDERVLEPAIAAMRRYGLEISDYVASEPVLALAEKLVAVSPASLTRVEFDISGTESVEMAMRLMRGHDQRPLILTFFGQYHGESSAALALGSQGGGASRYVRELTPGYVHVPYPHPYRCPFHRSAEVCDGQCVIEYIEEFVLGHYTTSDRIAGVLIEPVMGESGVLIPPDPFWPALVDLCRRHEWLLCADEVQSGIGRTGKLFAVEHWGVEPDLMCLAKGLSGGVLPIGATLGSEAVMGASQQYLGGTFAWTPAACVAAQCNLEVIEGDQVLTHVADLERLVVDRMAQWPKTYEYVGDVRVKGLYIAVEFVEDRTSKRRAVELCQRIHLRSLRGGVAGIYSHGMSVLRWLPALTMTEEIMTRALDVLEDAIATECGRGY